MQLFAPCSIFANKYNTKHMYYILPDRELNEPEGDSYCIYCDWRTYYCDVEETATALLKKWNAENSIDLIHSWRAFIDEAVEILAQSGKVECSCKSCN